MKKIIVSLFLMLCLSGCGKNDIFDYEKKFEVLATNYFEKYQMNTNLDVAEVYLKDLKEVNEQLGENFDLTDMENCDDDSVVRIYLKKGTNKIEKYEFDLKCSEN